MLYSPNALEIRRQLTRRSERALRCGTVILIKSSPIHFHSASGQQTMRYGEATMDHNICEPFKIEYLHRTSIVVANITDMRRKMRATVHAYSACEAEAIYRQARCVVLYYAVHPLLICHRIKPGLLSSNVFPFVRISASERAIWPKYQSAILFPMAFKFTNAAK